MWETRRAIHKMYDENLRDLYGSEVFEARIPTLRSTRRRSPTASPSLCTSRRERQPAVQALADEILARLAASMHVGEAA